MNLMGRLYKKRFTLLLVHKWHSYTATLMVLSSAPNELTTEVLSNSVISTNKVKMISIGDEWVSGHEGLLVNALIREGL